LPEQPIPMQIPLRKGKHANKFLFDNRINNKLIHAFDEIYPLLGYEFNEIIENMPNNIDSYKKFIESLHEKRKLQETCKHEYGKPSIGPSGYCSRECSKCKHKKKVKESLCKIVSEVEELINNNCKIETVEPPLTISDTKVHKVKLIIVTSE